MASLIAGAAYRAVLHTPNVGGPSASILSQETALEDPPLLLDHTLLRAKTTSSDQPQDHISLECNACSAHFCRFNSYHKSYPSDDRCVILEPLYKLLLNQGYEIYYWGL